MVDAHKKNYRYLDNKRQFLTYRGSKRTNEVNSWKDPVKEFEDVPETFRKTPWNEYQYRRYRKKTGSFEATLSYFNW